MVPGLKVLQLLELFDNGKYFNIFFFLNWTFISAILCSRDPRASTFRGLEMLQLSILTPGRVLFRNASEGVDSEISSVLIPSADGQLGILKNHCPLVTSFSTGLLKINFENSSPKYFAVIDGFVKIQNNIITILCRFASDSNELDSVEILENENKYLKEKYSKNPGNKFLKELQKSILFLRVKKASNLALGGAATP